MAKYTIGGLTITVEPKDEGKIGFEEIMGLKRTKEVKKEEDYLDLPPWKRRRIALQDGRSTPPIHLSHTPSYWKNGYGISEVSEQMRDDGLNTIIDRKVKAEMEGNEMDQEKLRKIEVEWEEMDTDEEMSDIEVAGKKEQGEEESFIDEESIAEGRDSEVSTSDSSSEDEDENGRLRAKKEKSGQNNVGKESFKKCSQCEETKASSYYFKSQWIKPQSVCRKCLPRKRCTLCKTKKVATSYSKNQWTKVQPTCKACLPRKLKMDTRQMRKIYDQENKAAPEASKKEKMKMKNANGKQEMAETASPNLRQRTCRNCQKAQSRSEFSKREWQNGKPLCVTCYREQHPMYVTTRSQGRAEAEKHSTFADFEKDYIDLALERRRIGRLKACNDLRGSTRENYLTKLKGEEDEMNQGFTKLKKENAGWFNTCQQTCKIRPPKDIPSDERDGVIDLKKQKEKEKRERMRKERERMIQKRELRREERKRKKEQSQ